MNMKSTRNAGFTLVELSIVLVIIGLIIGGVLTGRQIMQNAQVTNALNSIQAFEAQFQTYVQNYGAVPGNDAGAHARFPNEIPATVTVAESLTGNFDSKTATDETALLWAEMRAAGLVKNATPNTAQPANPFGGVYGFQYTAFNSTLTGNVLCLNNVPGDAAQAIDSRLDDGTGNTGHIQAMDTTVAAGEPLTGTATTVPYLSSDTYTLCMGL